MTPERRVGLDRDAGGSDLEEAAVCYLQVLLAGQLPGVGRERMFADMDHWGYSFRLGSTRAGRSEERRVGEEGRSRWAPDHLKKKKNNHYLYKNDKNQHYTFTPASEYRAETKLAPLYHSCISLKA